MAREDEMEAEQMHEENKYEKVHVASIQQNTNRVTITRTKLLFMMKKNIFADNLN